MPARPPLASQAQSVSEVDALISRLKFREHRAVFTVDLTKSEDQVPGAALGHVAPGEQLSAGDAGVQGAGVQQRPGQGSSASCLAAEARAKDCWRPIALGVRSLGSSGACIPTSVDADDFSLLRLETGTNRRLGPMYLLRGLGLSSRSKTLGRPRPHALSRTYVCPMVSAPTEGTPRRQYV